MTAGFYVSNMSWYFLDLDSDVVLGFTVLVFINIYDCYIDIELVLQLKL